MFGANTFFGDSTEEETKEIYYNDRVETNLDGTDEYEEHHQAFGRQATF